MDQKDCWITVKLEDQVEAALSSLSPSERKHLLESIEYNRELLDMLARL